jgi:phosphopantetheinyl transferase
MGWLSDEERERHARFVFQQDRESYLAAHAMLRLALGGYRGPFSVGVHGKPFLEQGPEVSLSHTRGAVAVAISTSMPVGVDVENVERSNDWRKLLGRVLSPAEIATLHALPEAEQQPRFYEFWTLKEAWSKALALGLHADFPSLNSLQPDLTLRLCPIDPPYRLALAALWEEVEVRVGRCGWKGIVGSAPSV